MRIKNELSSTRNYMFDSKFSKTYTHIVDSFVDAVYVVSKSLKFLIIFTKFKLNLLIEFEKHEYY